MTFPNFDKQIIKLVGDGPAIYNGIIRAQIVFEMDVQRVDDDGVFYFNKFEMTFLNAEVEPQVKAKVLFNCKTYHIHSVVLRDDSITTCAVRL